MKTLRRTWNRLRGSLTGRRREQEVADELQSHIEMQIEDNLLAGMAPEEARRAALLKFGSVESAKESYRDQRGAPILENLFWDLRHALRGLRKNPGFTAVAVITLALGIGANTAIFSVADAVLFRPLPFKDPDRLYLIQMLNKRTGQQYTMVPNEYLRALDESHRGFSAVGVIEPGPPVIVQGAAGLERVPIRAVSPNYFQILGIRPARGRLFDSGDAAQRGRSAMLTSAAWRQRFGADERIVGSSIKLGAATFDIVGVLPADLMLPSYFGGKPEIVTVLEPEPLGAPGGVVHPIVRLNPHVTREQAQAEIEALVAPLVARNPRTVDSAPILADIRSTLYPVGRDIMRFLLAAAGLVLLIGCANLANMLLTRTQRREHENGVRAALGASRARLMRPAIFESVIVGLTGAALAVLATSVTFDALLRQVPKAAYANAQVGVNFRVVGLALALGFVGGLMFAVAPAWRAARLDALALIQGRRSSGGGRSGRFGAPMVAVQIAVAIVLVFGAILAGRAFVSVLRSPLGFTPENVITIQVVAPGPAGIGRQEFYTRAVEALAGRRDVVSSGAIGSLPLGGAMGDEGIRVPGSTKEYGAYHVLPGYFETADIHLVRGRLPRPGDLRGAGVALLSESSVRALFPGREPLGATVEDSKGRLFTIVGIVANVRTRADRAPESIVYITPGNSTRIMTLVARTRTHNQRVAEELKRQITALAPNTPVTVQWWTDSIGDLTEYRNPRFQTLVLGSFAVLALGLTGLGVYGIVAFMVAIRTHEMGIRMAIGATPRTLVYFMVRQAFAPVIVGLVMGLLGTRWLSSLAQAQLYKVETQDPVTLALAATTVVAAAFLAAYIPARHVSRIDPMVALRHE